jgi:hypothetical protein
MDNHYHLLVRTPFPNLGKVMQHLNGNYTQEFNKLENLDGALFRGRYKAILIQDDAYLLQVSRYIHLNPVEANLCKNPESYTWSSYKNYINPTTNSFVFTNHILDQIGSIKTYIDFTKEGIDEKTRNFYNKSIVPVVLGNNSFKLKSLNKINDNKIKSSLPDIKRLSHLPEICEIINTVANFFMVNSEIIINDKNSRYYKIAIYLCKFVGQHSYSKIAGYFNCTVDSARGILRRHNKNLSSDENIYQMIEILSSAKSRL